MATVHALYFIIFGYLPVLSAVLCTATEMCLLNTNATKITICKGHFAYDLQHHSKTVLYLWGNYIVLIERKILEKRKARYIMKFPKADNVFPHLMTHFIRLLRRINQKLLTHVC